MTRSTLFAAALSFFALTADAAAQCRFINLSNRDVFIARWSYSPAESRSGDLTVYTEGGWSYSGWTKLPPGETWETSAGNYYVKDSNGRISWNNRPTSTGYVTAAKFSVFLPEGGNFKAEAAKLEKKGYRKETFQALGNGNWTIGSAWKLSSKKFDFDFSSRDVKFHSGSYPVTGKVSYIAVSAKEWGAKGKNWAYKDKKAWVSLSTEGAQKRPFGPREKGYYSGSVTVYYTEKK